MPGLTLIPAGQWSSVDRSTDVDGVVACAVWKSRARHMVRDDFVRVRGRLVTVVIVSGGRL